jgi:DNA-binding response OmpR family regulator
LRILLVEDDKLLGDGIRAGLMLASYAVDWVSDGEMALRALSDHDYDACVLDLGLPKKDGIAVLRELRQRNAPDCR